jgi:hypothetical protein
MSGDYVDEINCMTGKTFTKQAMARHEHEEKVFKAGFAIDIHTKLGFKAKLNFPFPTEPLKLSRL